MTTNRKNAADVIPKGMVTSAEKVAAHVRITKGGEGAGVRLDLDFIDYYEHTGRRPDGHIHFHGENQIADCRACQSLPEGTKNPNVAHFGDLHDLAATLGYALRFVAEKAPAR